MFHFQLHHADSGSLARRATFQTPHGPVETPGFMPVGTQGTVKGLTIDQVASTGAQMILGNTYHLGLRPGHETVRALGGLHTMCGWEGPILTDSGGFQVFSLQDINKIDEQSVVFRSHIDGAMVDLSPEHSIEIQESLGSDVAMVLDHVVALPAETSEVELAMERSVR
ncbi:MAG: tRNA guanosine(34) transglycosylase Tgt, partial [Planctomycetota bacterium]